MRTIFITLLIAFGFSNLAAQTRLSGELLGSNFMGISLNMEKTFPVSDNHKIGFLGGMGIMFQGQYEPHWLIKPGIYYYYKSWGIGLDATPLFRIGESPSGAYSEIDVYIYPNLNYNWFLNENWFLRFSLGGSITRNNVIDSELGDGLPEGTKYWNVNFSPFAGISFGRNLNWK